MSLVSAAVHYSGNSDMFTRCQNYRLASTSTSQNYDHCVSILRHKWGVKGNYRCLCELLVHFSRGHTPSDLQGQRAIKPPRASEGL